MENQDFNKPALPYPTERGSLSFKAKEVQSEKDKALNLAIETAQGEFNRLKAIAEIINNQARDIQKQLETSALINKAKYNFTPRANEIYWLVHNKEDNQLLVCNLGPKDWSVSPPDNYEYLQKIKYLANGLWQNIT